ncbi:D-aspartate oxidase [Chionoecetes opilio]|uniref:D-aspartate oxidase n=1 Tax=Chionoecetes opilio TaxID=41210 RepID=A0A8J4Y624_CHIOP|nr:D-aspartate oxidase [Chionoecetes opilio]
MADVQRLLNQENRVTAEPRQEGVSDYGACGGGGRGDERCGVSFGTPASPPRVPDYNNSKGLHAKHNSEWAGITWQQFSEWYSKGEGKSRGLSLIHGTTLNSVLEPPPSWQHIPLGYASLTPDQCAQFGPRYKSGSRYTTFIAEPSKLLPSLLRDLKTLGTRLEVRCLSSLKEAADEADLVINCSGLGARDLVPDPFMFPVRGQVIRVVHNYGHGSCGVTLFWGCSQEVASLASRLILRHHGHASKL